MRLPFRGLETKSEGTLPNPGVRAAAADVPTTLSLGTVEEVSSVHRPYCWQSPTDRAFADAGKNSDKESPGELVGSFVADSKQATK